MDGNFWSIVQILYYAFLDDYLHLLYFQYKNDSFLNF